MMTKCCLTLSHHHDRVCVYHHHVCAYHHHYASLEIDVANVCDISLHHCVVCVCATVTRVAYDVCSYFSSKMHVAVSHVHGVWVVHVCLCSHSSHTHHAHDVVSFVFAR